MEPTDQAHAANQLHMTPAGMQNQPVAVHQQQQVAIAGPSTSSASRVSSSQLQEVQRQVNEVVEVMKKNVEGIQAREQNLNELELRAASLEQTSAQFSTTATQLQKKMWWQNMKWTWIGIGAVTGILAIIIIILIVNFS